MSSTSEYTELVRKGQDQYLAAVRESQHAIVDAVGAWSQTFQGFTSAVPAPDLGELPTAEELIDNTFDLVEKLVAGQREFARNLVGAAAPATKAAKSSKPAAQK
jgi:hypothetical protein